MSTSYKYYPLISKPWVYHSLFWLSYYAFAALISLSVHQIYDRRFYWQLLTMLPPDMILVYVNLYILLPVLLLRRKFILYIISLVIILSLESLLNVFLHHLYALAGSAAYAPSSDLNSRNFFAQFLNGIYLLGLVTALKFFKDWMSQRQQLQEKEQQRVATELNFLKSQIHPHFFFNTLNNLYSLTLQKSDLAPEVVLKLSDLMSYMLYESGAPLVPLDKEIRVLENYLALEKLRFDQRLSLTFEKEGVPILPAEPISIPPLILLAFVENGFKHGMNHMIGDGRIHISLKLLPQHLLFTMENPVARPEPPALPPAKPPAEPPAGKPLSTFSSALSQDNNGIGLKNVIRRLDLLYGARYQLDLLATEDSFHVTLKMPLS